MNEAAPTSELIMRLPDPAKGSLRQALGRQSKMLYNAAALSLGAGATAILGFCYWWYAARMFSAEAVGYAAAAISVMNLLALASEFGMGTLLIGELPKMPETAETLISAALLSALITAMLIAVSYLALAGWLSIDLGSITNQPMHQLSFVIGVAVTGFTLVLDQAFVAMLRSSFQMSRTISFAASKLLMLVVAGPLGVASEFGIFDTWIGGQLCSIALLWIFCLYCGKRVWHTPRVRILKPLISTVLRHHVLSIVIQAPGLILPFIVAVVLSPKTNAAFYAAWTLVNVVMLVPASLTSVLYSVGSREPASMANRLRMSLAISTVVAVAAAVGLLFSSQFVLGIFNPTYPSIAGASLSILGFGAIGTMVKYHYVVVQRLRYRMVDASIVLGIFGAFELIAAIVGAQYGGLFGLTEAWLLAVSAEATVLVPTLYRSLRNKGAAMTELPSILVPGHTFVASKQQSGELTCRT